jgi:hypothetical protein
VVELPAGPSSIIVAMDTELMSGWTMMRTQKRDSRPSPLWTWGAVVLGVITAVTGCERAEATQTALAEGAPATAEAPSRAGTASVAEESFKLELKANGSYEAKSPSEVTIVLLAKGPYKINDKYPYKFKLQKSEGVTFPSDVVRKENVKLEHKKAEMRVAFTPESSGSKQIAGLFSFSVCTDERCVIEKRDLAINVDVK